MAALRQVPEQLWTHEQQRLLHPRTTYSRAIEKVTSAWLDAFSSLDALSMEMRFGRPVDSAGKVSGSYAHLIQTLNEHVESCYAVMRCLGQPSSDQELWHQRAARKQDLPGLRTFDEQVDQGYRRLRLGEAANLLKHSGARLNIVAMRSGFAFTLGYFLDGPLPGGVIGPNRRLHSDGNSAFSFNRDMLLHWWWLFRSSELMSKVIQAAINRVPGAPLQSGLSANDNEDESVAALKSATETAASAAVGGTSFDELCRRIAGIGLDFFVDEGDLPFPLVVLNPARQAMRMKYPAGRRANPIAGQPAFSVVMTIDDVGLTYKLPYFGVDSDVGATLKAKP